MANGEGRRLTPARVILVAAIGLVLGLALFAVTAVATDQPDFCATCHEMGPYHSAWAAGPHADVSCIECHVAAGLPARFAHKFEALKEVVAHFSGDTGFPRPLPASVPDGRCLDCHPKPGPVKPAAGFSHADHREKAACQRCHEEAGHAVSTADLKAAGIFDQKAAAQRRALAAEGFEVAAPGAGTANVPGHREVACSRCHDLAMTGCPACHEPPAKPDHAGRTKCSECHRPGAEWSFAHSAGDNCRECHKAPANHFGADCARCHSPQREFAATTFSHPAIPGGEHSASGFACKKCHPRTFAAASCTCHGGGIFTDD